MLNKELIGRQHELAELKKTWAEVCNQNKPRLVLLLGDSGCGKTKLVQEFYKSLAADQEKVGTGTTYWPATLPEGEDMAVNPAVKSLNPDAPIPWLWWGMRAGNPGERNIPQDDGCALTRSATLLERHVGPATRRRMRKEAHAKAGGAVLDLGKDVITSVPGVQTLVSIYDAGSSLWTAIQALGESRSADKADFSPSAIDKERKQLVKETSLTYLKLFLDDCEKDLPTVPAILVLDDAQWLDDVTLAFIRDALDVAREKSWPLMIVATHWETEWKQSPNQPDSLKRVWSDLQEGKEGLAVEIPIRKMDCTPLLTKYDLDNIGQKATDHMIEQADGNPFIMLVLIQILQEAQEDTLFWFEDEDRNQSLSDDGFELFESRTRGLDGIFRTRIKQISSDKMLKSLLTLGAHQGMQFFRQFTAELFRRADAGDLADMDEKSLSETFKQAADHYNAIDISEAPPVATFKHFKLRALLKEQIGPKQQKQWDRQIPELAAEWVLEERMAVELVNLDFFLFAKEALSDRAAEGGKF